MSACYAGKEDWASALAEAVAVVKLKPDWPKAPMQSTHSVTDGIRRGVTGGGRCHCRLLCVALQGYFRMAQALIKLDRNIEVTLQRAVAASCMPCHGVPPAVPHLRAPFAQARCCCDMGLVLDDANKVIKD